MTAATPPAEGPEAGRVNWTREQDLAIRTRGSNLLVSAAAGAGKTAVLVERVIRLVLGGSTSVDELLVVTFTEAAAAEMRDRVARALRERLEALDEASAPDQAARLRLQLALLGRASISTLHSFCLSVCRRYFYRLGLDPAFEVLAEEEAELLRSEVLDEVLEELYDRGDPGFTGLVEAYGTERGDDRLREVVLRLHDFSRSHPRPARWLDQAASLFEPAPGSRLADLPYGRAVMEDVVLALEAAAQQLHRAEAIAARPDGPVDLRPALAEDAARLATSARRAGSGAWETMARAVAEAAEFQTLPRAPRGQGDDPVRKRVRAIREKVKDTCSRLRDRYAGRSEADFLDEVRALAGPMRSLAALVTRFDLAYRRAKDDRAVVDFGDLEHFCLQVLAEPGDGEALTPSEAAVELRRRYAEVLVDEYQDINEVQEAILNLVSRGDNLFMVGDVKQSIYRFRLAEPALFEGKYRSYRPLESPGAGEPLPAEPPGAGEPLPPDSSGGVAAGRCLDLPANFRSRKPILDAVNFIFRQVMRADAAEIDYGPAGELVYGADFYGPPGIAGPAVELHLLEGEIKAESAGPGAEADTADGTGPDGEPAGDQPEDGDAEGEPGDEDEDQPGRIDPEDLESLEREALVVAHRIREMVEGPTPLEVWDKQARAYRRVRYGDVAVLLRATTGLANLVLDILTRSGVPASAQLSTGYFTATEVETVLSLLQVIDNPRQDIPLAAVLRCPVVGLDENDLARVRLFRRTGGFYEAVVAAAGGDGQLGARLTRFLRDLESWREAARRGPLSTLLWRLYRETGLYAYVGGLPNGAQRQANLRGLYDRARQFDRFSRQGLARFLRFVDHLRETGQDLGPPQPYGEADDAVRIMSIHRSKGQEFPVVFLAHLGKKFNFRDCRGDLLCHRTLGLGPMVADPSRRLKYPSLPHQAVARQNRAETVAEEMRCLYVGLTRARDCLVLVGTKRKLPQALAEWCLSGRPEPPRGLLPAAQVARAESFLDWIGPALASHPQAEPLRAVAGCGTPASGEPRPGSPAADPSLWDIRLWGLPGFPAIPAAVAPLPGRAEPGPEWAEVARLQPLVNVSPGRITAALDWVYPAGPFSARPAKVAPTELKRLLDGPGEDGEAAPLAPGPDPSRPESGSLADVRPAFLQASAGPTPAERGKATHLLLQHADLGGPLDEAALERLAAWLADREIMTPEQAGSADLEAVARFFRSDLGRWLVSARASARREIPFSLGLPAEEIYGEPLPATGPAAARAPAPAGDLVLVQGIIDVVIDEPDGLTILDFKTDRLPADQVPARAEAYRPQVAVYRRAVETIWRRPVKAVYLYFLTPGVAVNVR